MLIFVRTVSDSSRRTDRQTFGQTKDLKDLWMDRQLDVRQLDGWTIGSTDKWTHEQLDSLAIGQMDNWSDGQLDEQTNGHMDYWMDAQLDKEMNGQTDEHTEGQMYR